MEYRKIESDFIKRTLSIIEEYSGDNEVTLLINCCIGLLVLPKEKYKNLPKSSSDSDYNVWGLSKDNIQFGSIEYRNYKISNIIRRMRNGVSHFNIVTLPNGSGNISTLKISDKDPRNSANTFSIEIQIENLKHFLTKLANHVLDV